MRVLGICTGLPFLVLSIFYSLSHPSARQTSSSMNICPVTWNCSGWGLGFYDSEPPLPRSMEGVVMISILHQNQAVRTRCILGSDVSQKGTGRHLRNASPAYEPFFSVLLFSVIMHIKLYHKDICTGQKISRKKKPPISMD